MTSSNETVIITGAAGFTGYAVARRMASNPSLIPLFHRTQPPDDGLKWLSCDLQDRKETHYLLDHIRPQVIVHCAALSDPVYCEQNPQDAYAVNLGATENLMSWAAPVGCFLVHLSTDLVFDGEQGNYREEDRPRPISVYGSTKLEAEGVILESAAESCIVRTSVIYGRSLSGRHSVNEKLAAQWKQGKPIPLFIDEYRSPTPVGELAAALVEIVEKRIGGLLNVAGSERISRYEFGRKVALRLGFGEEHIVAKRIAEVASIPPRAPDVSLDISKARRLLSCKFSSLDDALAAELTAPSQA